MKYSKNIECGDCDERMPEYKCGSCDEFYCNQCYPAYLYLNNEICFNCVSLGVY